MRNVTFWTDNSILTPWRGLMDLQRNLDRVLDQAWDENREARGSAGNSMQPPCDIEETESHYLVTVDLPGIMKKDITVTMKDGTLVVSAERRGENTNLKFSERYFGKFHRSFTLPPGIDVNNIEAHYQNGVLTLALAKAETAKAREIKISEGKGSFFGRLVAGDNDANKREEKSAVSAV